MAASDAPATVKSAMRALEILEFLVSQQRPMAAHELSTALGIPVSSLSYLLTTLVELGYLARDGRRYAPGQALARLQPATGGPALAERVAPLVRSIKAELNETVGFFVRRGLLVEALVSEVGVHALRYTLDVGQQAPLHAFAAGKVLLATLEPGQLEDYLGESERVAYTANSITDADALRAEIEQVRAEGFAWTRQEHTLGIVGLARAARIEGRVVGAFSVATPIVRFTPELETRAKALLVRACGMLEG